MSNPLSAVGHFFKNIGGLFVKLFGQEASDNFVSASKGVLQSAAGELALEAVKEAELVLAGALGSEKHNFAVDKIETDAKAKGIEVSKSLINLLIELALHAVIK